MKIAVINDKLNQHFYHKSPVIVMNRIHAPAGLALCDYQLHQQKIYCHFHHKTSSQIKVYCKKSKRNYKIEQMT